MSEQTTRGRGRPPKEGGHRLNLLIDAGAKAALDAVRGRLGLSATAAVERALVEYERALRWQPAGEKKV